MMLAIQQMSTGKPRTVLSVFFFAGFLPFLALVYSTSYSNPPHLQLAVRAGASSFDTSSPTSRGSIVLSDSKASGGGNGDRGEKEPSTEPSRGGDTKDEQTHLSSPPSRFVDSKLSPRLTYAVVIDAGSTGSRVSVYRVYYQEGRCHGGLGKATVRMPAVAVRRIGPGIALYAKRLHGRKSHSHAGEIVEEGVRTHDSLPGESVPSRRKSPSAQVSFLGERNQDDSAHDCRVLFLRRGATAPPTIMTVIHHTW